MLHMISVGFFPLIYQVLICGPGCDLSWRMFHVHLKKKWNILFSDEMPCRYQLGPTGPMYHLNPVFSYYFYVWIFCPLVWIGYQCCVVINLAAQSCLTLCNLMDCSLPGSSVLGDSPGKNTGVGRHSLLQEIFPTQGSDPGLPYCRWILYHLNHQESYYYCVMSISPLPVVIISLMYWGAPILGTYIFISVISSSWIYPLIVM